MKGSASGRAALDHRTLFHLLCSSHLAPRNRTRPGAMRGGPRGASRRGRPQSPEKERRKGASWALIDIASHPHHPLHAPRTPSRGSAPPGESAASAAASGPSIAAGAASGRRLAIGSAHCRRGAAAGRRPSEERAAGGAEQRRRSLLGARPPRPIMARSPSPPPAVGGRALAAAAAASAAPRGDGTMPPPPPRRPRAAASTTPLVLDEDDWVASIAAIVERDYFPELPRLASRLEWLRAVRSGDPLLLRDAQRNIAARRAGAATPARGTGATPGWTPAAAMGATPAGLLDTPANGGGWEGGGGGGGELGHVSAAARPRAPPMTLDAFLAAHTSEDNAAFAAAVERAARARVAAAAEGRGGGGALARGTHNPGNALFLGMRTDPVLALPPASSGASEPPAPRPTATRFGAGGCAVTGSSSGGSGASTPAALRAGGGGSDHDWRREREVAYGGGPDRAWARVATPNLAPGAGGASPLVTWGVLAGTPLRLDGGGDEYGFAPTAAELAAAARDDGRGRRGFSIAPPPEREALGRAAAARSRPSTLRAGAGSTPLHARSTPVSAAGARLAARLRSASATPGRGRDLAGVRASYRRPGGGGETPAPASRGGSRAPTPADGQGTH